ncbi:hypothetical protein DF18_07135 [Streptomyces rimosus]|nr:hypothetical protein DF18_07135 [Streptomyces rimosus]
MLATWYESLRVPTPIAAAMTRLRTKPRMRETSVPAAMTALDFSSDDARPPERLAGAAGSGAGIGGCSGTEATCGTGSCCGVIGRCGSYGCCWSRYRCAKASGSRRSSAAREIRSSTPTNCVVAASSPYGRCRVGPCGSGGGVGAHTCGSGVCCGAGGCW